jgi:hypothetical protein
MRDGEFAHKASLFGHLEKTKDIRGYIGCGIKRVNDRLPEEEYKGSYEAVSRPFKDSYLETKNKRLKDNIHVKEIPYYETSNLSDGVTVYIGSDVEVE